MDNNVVFKSKHGNFFKKEDVEDDYYVFEVRDQQQILITKDQLLPEKAVSPILNILWIKELIYNLKLATGQKFSHGSF